MHTLTLCCVSFQSCVYFFVVLHLASQKVTLGLFLVFLFLFCLLLIILSFFLVVHFVVISHLFLVILCLQGDTDPLGPWAYVWEAHKSMEY